MTSRYRALFFFLAAFLFLSEWLLPAAAQGPELTLRLSRDWGYGGPKGDIEGTFSFHAEGPANLTAVEFYIDNTRVGRVEEPPWTYRFVTENYPLGQHELYAIGYTADGRTLKSNVLVRNFVPKSESWKFIIMVGVPILLLGLAIPALIYWNDRKRNPGKYSGYGGAFGGAVCPKCGCPFPRHWWGLNFGGRKYDRCPHCGKWSLVGRASEAELKAAAIACGLEPPESPPALASEEDEKSLEKRLDESRYFDES